MAQSSVIGEITQKALKKTAVDVTVVGGAGHVGIPLALSFAAKGMRVMINDLNEKALEQLQAGIVPFTEEGAEELLRENLEKKTARLFQPQFRYSFFWRRNFDHRHAGR